MTLEEQLQNMARTDAERQLIRRWMQRAPSQPQHSDDAAHRTATDAPNPTDAIDATNRPKAARG